MKTAVRARLIRIGNSRGVRIPKPLVEQCGLTDEVDLVVKGDALVISPARKAREGWDQAFADMSKRGDDRLLLPDLEHGWDDAEWIW